MKKMELAPELIQTSNCNISSSESSSSVMVPVEFILHYHQSCLSDRSQSVIKENTFFITETEFFSFILIRRLHVVKLIKH